MPGRRPDAEHRRYWVETLGCPKNQVDSDKLSGTLLADGMAPAGAPEEADLVVVNTCAFIEAARQESVETILELADSARPGARLVVTGCMATRYGEELAEALPEVDLVAGFGVPVTLDTKPGARPSLDLLNLPRPPASAPWAYVKVAEGCDRACGFCAIPGFRGPQRSRTQDSILQEVSQIGVAEVVLVAQDLASYGRDVGRGGSIVDLVRAVAERVERVRLLYLYPSSLTGALVEAICATGVPYFDLSLQHVSPPLLRRMRRWGNGSRFLDRIGDIRAVEPDAALRSSFIVGYPGETEEDHDALLGFLEAAELDWTGFFAYSCEEGTLAAGLPDQVPSELVSERLAECGALADVISARRRAELVGREMEVLVDSPGVARSHREAPEIDGIVSVPESLQVGSLVRVVVTAAEGPDLVAIPLAGSLRWPAAGSFVGEAGSFVGEAAGSFVGEAAGSLPGPAAGRFGGPAVVAAAPGVG